MRVFLKNDKGRNKADGILQFHNFFNNAGPMWLGNLWNKSLAEKMHKNAADSKIFQNNRELIKFLKTIREESKINAVGFYDLHEICAKDKIKSLLKKEAIKEKIKKIGYKASDTHFRGEGIRSDIPISKLVKILENK